jgi:hypothetical protein
MWCLLQIYNTSRPIVDTILIPVIADVGGSTFLIDKKNVAAHPPLIEGVLLPLQQNTGGKYSPQPAWACVDIRSQFFAVLLYVYTSTRIIFSSYKF